MRSVALLFVLCLLLVNLPAQAQTNEQVAEEVIAITKAQWAAQIAKLSVATAMKNVAAEYTEFNGDFPTRLDSKDLNMRLGEASASGVGELVAAEMANEKVQVHGNVAILTYNFIGMAKNQNGVVEPVLAKSTRVYVNQGGEWTMVHANFAPVP